MHYLPATLTDYDVSALTKQPSNYWVFPLRPTDEPREYFDLIKERAYIQTGANNEPVRISAWGDSQMSGSEPGCVDDQWLAYLSHFPTIEALDLSSCKQLTNRGLNSIGGLPQLRDLNLFDTRIGDAGLSYLSHLSELREIGLGWTRTKFGVKHLVNSSLLESLWLNRSCISDKSVSPIGDFTQLKALNLMETKISEKGLGFLSRLDKIEYLILENTKIGDTACELLLGLDHLNSLSLNETCVGDRGLQLISTLKNLVDLKLRATRITDAGLKHLYGLRKLQDVNLHGTQVTSHGFAELSEALPECDISWHETPATSSTRRVISRFAKPTLEKVDKALSLVKMDRSSRYLRAFWRRVNNRRVYQSLSRSDVDRLIASDDWCDTLDSAIMDCISYKFNPDYSNDFEIVSSLTPALRMVYCTWWLDAEINNGGLYQFFFNKGKYALITVDSCRLIGASEHASLLLEAIKIHTEEEPTQELFQPRDVTEILERYQIASHFSDLPSLDTAYGKLPSLAAMRSDYQADHPEEFVIE